MHDTRTEVTGGIDMRPAELGHDKHAGENPDGPTSGDDDPSTLVAIGFIQHDVGNDASAEQYGYPVSDDFSYKW